MWGVAEWEVQPTLFGLLGQCPSQDTVPSFNVLDNEYYDKQHNRPLRAQLERGTGGHGNSGQGVCIQNPGHPHLSQIFR